jgi:predicted DNA-binding transcriptional regulator YafY
LVGADLLQESIDEIDTDLHALRLRNVFESLLHRASHVQRNAVRASADRRVLRLCVCDDRSLRAWILGFGAMATVLSPKKLAQGIYEEIDAARERYAPRLKFEMLRHPSSRIANLASRFTARVS